MKDLGFIKNFIIMMHSNSLQYTDYVTYKVTFRLCNDNKEFQDDITNKKMLMLLNAVLILQYNTITYKSINLS